MTTYFCLLSSNITWENYYVDNKQPTLKFS